MMPSQKGKNGKCQKKIKIVSNGQRYLSSCSEDAGQHEKLGDGRLNDLKGVGAHYRSRTKEKKNMRCSNVRKL